MRVPVAYILLYYIFSILVIENKLIPKEFILTIFVGISLLSILVLLKFNKVRLFIIFYIVCLINLYYQYELYNIPTKKWFPKREVNVTLRLYKINTYNNDFFYESRIINIDNNKEFLLNKFVLLKLNQDQNYKNFNEIVIIKGLLHYEYKNGYETIFIDRFTILKNQKSFRIISKITDSIRTYIENIFQVSSHIDSNLIGFQKAIFLGNSKSISKSSYDNFKFSGTLHLFAVSGLHIGFIYIIFKKLISFLLIRGILSEIIITFILIIYLYIVEHPPSAVRAVLMIFLWQLSVIFFKKKNPISTLLLSCFIALIVDPRLLNNIGFQLSYTVVLSILIFTKKINNNDERKSSFKSLFIVSYAAFCGSFLLILDYFQMIVPGSILINTILFPSVFIIIITIFINLIINLSFLNYIIFFNYKIIIFITNKFSLEGVTYFKFDEQILLNNTLHLLYPITFFYYFSRFNTLMPKYLTFIFIPFILFIIFFLFFN